MMSRPLEKRNSGRPTRQVERNWGECCISTELTALLTGDVGFAVPALFQEIAICTAAVMGSYPILTDLVTDSPDVTVIVI
ncbi:hypothetical protein AOXY_G22865 [Acipenser oxyrinchus oxyrinchus]|uniref:Uncharacterized protein n=1 Tax=Acipenser oxyrinchus oxyrinchus TaxID=40147 RepID=A0AAD8CY19_ACIOX|nr:hypothetical protein AOXY_G22865 [Acipenser oxyrinchus oxyrinchus]